MEKIKNKKGSKKAQAVRKFTLRDGEGVLSEAQKIADTLPMKPSLNRYILEAISEYNKKDKS